MAFKNNTFRGQEYFKRDGKEYKHVRDIPYLDSRYSSLLEGSYYPSEQTKGDTWESDKVNVFVSKLKKAIPMLHIKFNVDNSMFTGGITGTENERVLIRTGNRTPEREGNHVYIYESKRLGDLEVGDSIWGHLSSPGYCTGIFSSVKAIEPVVSEGYLFSLHSNHGKRLDHRVYVYYGEGQYTYMIEVAGD